MRTQVRAVVVLTGILALLGAPVLAHEEGVLRLGSNEVGIGGQLEVRGEKLPKSAALRLELRGTLETFPLAEVRTDARGLFEAKLAVPVEARAGSYTVVALAPDGDIAARAELAVVTAGPAVAPADGMAEHEGHSAMNTSPGATEVPHPTAEIMKLPVHTTGSELAVIVGIITLSVAGGVALLRGARTSRE